MREGTCTQSYKGTDRVKARYILYISMIQGINCDLDLGLDRRKWFRNTKYIRNKVSVEEITAQLIRLFLLGTAATAILLLIPDNAFAWDSPKTIYDMLTDLCYHYNIFF